MSELRIKTDTAADELRAAQTEMRQLKATVAEAEEVAGALTAKREVLEHRVNLLRPDGLDRDLLEEQARKMLGYGFAGDIVVFDSTL